MLGPTPGIDSSPFVGLAPNSPSVAHLEGFATSSGRSVVLSICCGWAQVVSPLHRSWKNLKQDRQYHPEK